MAEQLTHIEEAEDDKSPASSFSGAVPQGVIDAELIRDGGSGIFQHRFRIYHFFSQHGSDEEAAKFLKKEYGTGGRSGPTREFSLEYSGKGLTFYKGSSVKPDVKVTVSWAKAAKRIRELIAADRYLTPQDMEIYPQYLEYLVEQALLREKDKFIDSVAALPPAEKRNTLALRLADFLNGLQRYEKEFLGKHGLPEIADATNTGQIDALLQSPQRVGQLYDALAAIKGATCNCFSRNHAWRFGEELAVLFPRKHVYHLGDTVYIGSKKYEMLAFSDTEVRLFDPEFPLLNEEMPRDEFDRKIAENPMNDHLLAIAEVQTESPHARYKRLLSALAEDVLQGDMYSYFQDAETQREDAAAILTAFIDAAADTEDFPGLREALEQPQLMEWLVADILERAYHGDSAGERNPADGLKEIDRLYVDANAQTAEWVYFNPDSEAGGQLVYNKFSFEQIQEAAAHHEDAEGFFGYLGSIARQTLIDVTDPDINAYRAELELRAHDYLSGATADAMSRLLAAASTREAEPTPIPQPGAERWSEPATPENAPEHPGEPSDDVDAYLPTTEESLTPAWEKAAPRGRAQSFDPHPEISMSERHNYRITDDDLGAGGAKTKFKANIEAIRTLQAVEAENRFATPEEQEVLARYVGWGGLADAFDAEKPAWANEHAELQALLTPEEYASARASTLNAHYTSPTVIKAIYKAIENMGFRSGNVLEPSCGIGNFFGLVPESMQDSKLFGVELDGLTGRIAQQLYQKNSIAIQGFENTDLPDSFFDVAIGNVPFGDYGVIDKRYDKHKFSIHDYFFAKTLDKVRPGGIVAFVTSRFMLDSKNPSVRKHLAQRADLLGAIRLPNTAFKSNAGTEVTTDIIFLQKRDRITDIEPDWVHLGQTEDEIPVNSYFAEHPDMMLGTMSVDSGVRMYGAMNSASCVPFPDSDLSEQLAEAVTGIHAEITEYERDEAEPEEDKSIPADPSVRNFSYTLVNGQIYYRQNSRMVPVELPVTTQNRVKGMIALRDCVRKLIEYQTENYPDHAIRAEQAKLNRLYDEFSRKYGLINSRGNSTAFSQDNSYCLLCSLEVLDENGELQRKADMFTKRTIKPHEPVTHVDTASEALAVSMSEKARVDLAYMSELTGMDAETLVKELEGVIFLNIGYADTQDKTYVTADEYLSGNVREKLALAKAAAATIPTLEVNVRALEAAVPPDLSAAEINVRLGATWLPPDVAQQFMYELLQTPRWVQRETRVHYSQHTGEWSISGKTADRSNVHAFNTYGTQRISAYKIIEESLNLRDVRIFDKVYNPDGSESRVLNKKETAIAQGKQEIIRSKFADWIWADPERRERLCRLYNDKFNSIRPREYDGSHIKFPGMNPEITLRKHQIDAIAHILYGGNTLLAHEVGAGKTYEMVAAAVESKRLGLCNKSLIVVPNHITEQWAGEFLQLYPSANILVATKKDFETKNRKKFCARIATGDYDAVIIGHSQFEKIPMSVERQKAMLQRQISELMMGIDEMKRNKGERFTIKQMEKSRKSLELKLTKLNDQRGKDDVVTFEELGVDRLFIDEAHYFKNLFLLTKMRNVAGIPQTEAQKSSDLFMKTQYLDELTGGRGTVFATGTPISNSMVELYTMQRYLQYDLLVQQGLQHFDAWASTFGETVTAIELAPEGTGYRAKTRFAKFFNLPELMSMFKLTADIQTADMLNLPVPKANFHTEVIKPSEWQQEMVEGLADRAEVIRAREVSPDVDNMLKVTNDGRKLALDQRLINPLLPGDPDGKVAACAANVFRTWEETRDKRLTQLVFCDMSTPKGDGSFNVYDDLKAKLTARGVPAEEIAFIHDADTEARKKELFAKVRQGKVRVLMGSTPKMGAGTNVQDRLIALHDLDCPWRPSDLAQRLGRIVRQGNKNPEVEIFRYVTEGTFDSYLYQLVENKQKFIAQIMTSKLPVRVAEDVDETALSYAEIKALATGNPLIIEKCQLEMEVNRLKILQASHLSQKYALEDALLKKYPQEVKRLTERVAGYKADTETVAKHPEDADHFPPMTIGGIRYAERKEAGTALLEACMSMTSPDPVPLGEYRGFQMELSFNALDKEYRITLKGALTHPVALGGDIFGNIARLDNKMTDFAEMLRYNEGQLADVQTQMETAKGEVDRPFPQEQEFTEKSARLKALNILLNMDEKDHELLDSEPDEGEMEPPPRTVGMER